MPRDAARTLTVRIEGVEMPGLRCTSSDADERHGHVHVGMQRRGEVVDLHPGDATRAEWSFEVAVEHLDDGHDFRGPFVHGRRGDRFLYLSWGVVDEAEFRMFRRAKLHFADAGADVLAAASETGSLHCRVLMTDASGNPRCARVRPPDAVWTSRAPG